MMAIGAHGLLLSDGDCGFCQTSAGLLQRWLPDVDTVPYQRVNVAQFGLSDAECAHEIKWVSPIREVFGGATGIAKMFTTFERPWRLLGVVLLLPGVSAAAAVAYRVVAANRHRLPTGSASCRL